MIYIDKKQPISQEANIFLKKWLESPHDDEGETYQSYVKRLVDEGKEGNIIWKVMTSKSDLKRFLVLEQGFVCCYCGQRIFTNEKTPIEHLQAKSIFKNKIYEYDNLMASCSGNSIVIKHIVENVIEEGKSDEEFKKIIEFYKKEYDISEEDILKLYVNDTDYKLVMKQGGREFDIEKLKKGDVILIYIPNKQNTHQRHCDTRKGAQSIEVHPLQEDCQEQFIYTYDDLDTLIDAKSEDDEQAKNTIDILGLNANPFINRQRKSIVAKTLLVRNRIMNSNRNQMAALLKQAIQFYSTNSNKHAPKLDEVDADFYKPAFWFVSVAVLKGNLKPMI